MALVVQLGFTVLSDGKLSHDLTSKMICALAGQIHINIGDISCIVRFQAYQRDGYDIKTMERAGAISCGQAESNRNFNIG